MRPIFRYTTFAEMERVYLNIGVYIQNVIINAEKRGKLIEKTFRRHTANHAGKPSLPLNLSDNLYCLLQKFFLSFNPCHITDCFQGMHTLLQKTQNIGRIDLHPVVIQKNLTDLPVVQPHLPEFKQFHRKFPLRTPALGRTLTVAFKKILVKKNDL